MPDGELLSAGIQDPIRVSIGGVGIVLRSGTEGLAICLDDRSRSFTSSSRADDIALAIRVGKPANSEGRNAIFQSGFWSLRESGTRQIFDFYAPALREGPYRSLDVDENWSNGEVLLDPSHYLNTDQVDPLEFPLAELLVIGKIARSGGVVLHACGIVDEQGRGILFPGNSGNGKTTTARLWAGRTGVNILSDDRVILRRGDGGFRAYGTPWHGEGAFGSNASAPPVAIFFPEHGEKNRTIEVSPAEAVSLLVQRSFPPFYDRVAVDAILETLSRLAGEIPCFRFPFVPGPPAVEFVRKTVSSL